MKRVIWITSIIALALIGLVLIPGLLDGILVFMIAGRLPYSEVSLPLPAMFAIYTTLFVLGVGQIFKFGADATDQQISQLAKPEKTTARKSLKSKKQPVNKVVTKKSSSTKNTQQPKRRRYQAL